MTVDQLPPKLQKRIRVDEASGCWLWVGHIIKEGYGRMAAIPAHRVVYEAAIGPIPTGLDIDHLCRVRHCVNPAHLEPVTRSENLRRGIGPALNRRRSKLITHCRHGHEFTPDNTYIHKTTGHRNCRECARLRAAPNAKWRWKRKPMRPSMLRSLDSEMSLQR